MRLPTGVRLGPYQLLEPLGAGGMGEVYKARDTRLDRTVAIKILPELFAADPDRRARFEREARAVAALNHSHICALHDVGESPSPASTPSSPEPIRFLVMEYLEGQTLADHLVRGPLPTADVLRYAIELADALDHAHRRGLIHRDLKPGNVMLTKGGAKLLDFGLSRLQSTPDLLALSTISPADVPLTAQGAVLGTFPYMAPEQLAAREAGAVTFLRLARWSTRWRPAGGPLRGRLPRLSSARSSTPIRRRCPGSNRWRRPRWTASSRAVSPRNPMIAGRPRAI